MKSGFTLTETALSLAVAGLLLAIALTSLTALKQGAAVEQAAQNIVAAHRRARAAAILNGKPAILSVAARSLRITLVGADRPHWASSGPLDQGVSLAGAPHDITFSPIGISIGLANASLQLSQGNAVRTVVISRLGRARIVRSP
jgi:prepilin-type N-terminal cleavage/methylation domain-containing protein